jgi:2-methylcitrate dehydratase PrpD
MLSYCAEQASGSWQWLLDSSHVEKAFVFAGMPARNGLEAAMMAQAGFSGVTDALDRPGGWMDSGVFKGPDSDLDRGYLAERLGERFELPLVGYKRFPTGGPTQAAVQAMLALAPRIDRRPMLSVTVEMPGDAAAFRAAEMPALNIPYLMAIILADGRLDFVAAQSKRRMAQDAAVRALMAKVEVAADPSQERTPRVESARVSVRLADETLSEFTPQVAGFPGRLLTRAEVAEKALALMAPRLGAGRAQRVCDIALELDAAPGVGALLDAATPQR